MSTRSAIIITERLRLVAATPEMLASDSGDRVHLARLLSAVVPNNWPPETLRDALDFFRNRVTEHPDLAGYWFWYWIGSSASGEPDTLLGSGGFKGEPDDSGTIEIGYSVLPQFHRKGFATEGADALIAWAWLDDRVQCIIGDTHEGNIPSRKTLRRLGFMRAGSGAEPGLLRFQLLRPK